MQHGIVGSIPEETTSTSYCTIQNCYNTGAVSGAGSVYNYQAGILARNGVTNRKTTYHKVLNCYCTNSISYYNVNAFNTGCISAANMKNYASNLGSAFKSDTSNKNGGYPILSWQ